MADPELAGRLCGRGPAAGTGALHLAVLRGRHRRELPLDHRAFPRRPEPVADTSVLTVRYERLGVRPGDRLLDLGAGGGRHAFEAMRRGAVVTALDADAGEIKDVSAMMAAITAEESARGPPQPGTEEPAWSATPSVFLFLLVPSTGSSRPRCSSTSPMTAPPSRNWPGCCAPGAPWPSPCPAGGRSCSPGPSPTTTTRSLVATSGSTARRVLAGRLVAGRTAAVRVPPCPRPAQPRTGGCGPLSGFPMRPTRCTGLPPDARVGYHRPHGPLTRVPEALLNPVLGKSVVLYLRKPA